MGWEEKQPLRKQGGPFYGLGGLWDLGTPAPSVTCHSSGCGTVALNPSHPALPHSVLLCAAPLCHRQVGINLPHGTAILGAWRGREEQFVTLFFFNPVPLPSPSGDRALQAASTNPLVQHNCPMCRSQLSRQVQRWWHTGAAAPCHCFTGNFSGGAEDAHQWLQLPSSTGGQNGETEMVLTHFKCDLGKRSCSPERKMPCCGVTHNTPWARAGDWAHPPEKHQLPIPPLEPAVPCTMFIDHKT